MTAPGSPRSGVRAAAPRAAVDLISSRAPEAEVVAIEDQADLSGFDFLVPVPAPQRTAELAAQVGELPRLAVIQVLSAGVDAIADACPPTVTLANAKGARDSAVSEWILGAILGAQTHLLDRARSRRWGDHQPIVDVHGSTVLVVGMGSIGRALQERLEALGANVVGVASRARDDLHGIEELADLLPTAHTVVLLTPLTEATRHLIGRSALAAMADGSLLVNAARGPVVDTDALVAELSTGRLRAVLDVTDPEPLPDDHPLWDALGLLAITPHIAGNSPEAGRRAARLVGDQLARFCRGEPLVNVVHQGGG